MAEVMFLSQKDGTVKVKITNLLIQDHKDLAQVLEIINRLATIVANKKEG